MITALRTLALAALMTVMTWKLLLTAAAGHDHQGRDVHLGDWAGVVRCESRGDADVLNTGGSGAAGAFQFMPRTWRWVAERHGRTGLADIHPADATLAQQLRQAIRLRDMDGGGLGHWQCRTYGHGPDWVTIVDEARMPKRPERCARNLVDRFKVEPLTARTVCGADR